MTGPHDCNACSHVHVAFGACCCMYPDVALPLAGSNEKEWCESAACHPR